MGVRGTQQWGTARGVHGPARAQWPVVAAAAGLECFPGLDSFTLTTALRVAIITPIVRMRKSRNRMVMSFT